MKKTTAIVLAAVIAIAAFVGGTFYGKASVPAAPAGDTGFVRYGLGAGRFGGGIVAGQIISKDAQSITLQLPNGNSEVVFYSPSTQIMVTKTSSGSASDLAAGTAVVISSSTANADGSVTAGAIQVRQGGAAGAGGGFIRVGAGG